MRGELATWNIRDWRIRDLSAFCVSMAVHGALLLAFWAYEMKLQTNAPEIALETVFADEREQQEFSQELDLSTEISETTNVVAGGTLTGDVGAGTIVNSAPAVSEEKIDSSGNLRELQLRRSTVELGVPGDGLLGEDLGSVEVTGEVGAVVEGYGAALSRMTQELIRFMREDRVLVVWLFDESESMKDDQEKLREQFHKVYEELRIFQESDAPRENRRSRTKKADEVLLTSIAGYGRDVHVLTPEPTSDIRRIRAAIDEIGVDESGEENMCGAVIRVVDRYRSFVQRSDRRMLIVVVSDESGDDGDALEEAISKAKQIQAPVYFLAREAIFGYPYARIVWKDPVYGLSHWLRIRRGPETAGPECLQWDGLHARWDSFSSGFGPYEQVRLAKETGGIFFLLPDIEENLAGAGSRANRRFDFLAMKQYEPLLLARREYNRQRGSSPFRSQLWKVISVLNPLQDQQLNIRELYYSIDPARFREQAKGEFEKALRAMEQTKRAVQLLEEIKPLRGTEASERWRANFDLAMAQCLAYRVRLFQYLLALDQHAKQEPVPVDPKNNVWNVRRRQEMLPPDPRQVEITKVDLAELEQQEQQARKLFQAVIAEHPGTPWAQRADYDLNSGFGMIFAEDFRDPRYDEFDRNLIKLPKL